jgi:hypothetical protein
LLKQAEGLLGQHVTQNQKQKKNESEPISALAWARENTKEQRKHNQLRENHKMLPNKGIDAKRSSRDEADKNNFSNYFSFL